MAKAATAEARALDAERVYAWRIEQAISLGYSEGDATEIAMSGADLHRLAAMLAAGCPRPLAKRIVV